MTTVADLKIRREIWRCLVKNIPKPSRQNWTGIVLMKYRTLI